jgi:hypothetical protein
MSAYIHIHLRQAVPLIVDRGSQLLPTPLRGSFFPPRLRDGVAAESNSPDERWQDYGWGHGGQLLTPAPLRGSFSRPGAEAQLARQVSGLRVNDMLVHEIESSMVTDLEVVYAA